MTTAAAFYVSAFAISIFRKHAVNRRGAKLRRTGYLVSDA